MGNNTAYKTVGIDNIPMKMFDGLVRTLKDVRNVLDLRKNILLLGALEAQGCNFSCANGALKIIKGSKTFLKVEHTVNLYKMIGSVMIGDASVAIELGTCVLDT